MIVCATCGSAVRKGVNGEYFHGSNVTIGTIVRKVRDTDGPPGPVGVRADRSPGPRLLESPGVPGDGFGSREPRSTRSLRARARIGTIKTSGTAL
jgi:hypothetical protein